MDILSLLQEKLGQTHTKYLKWYVNLIETRLHRKKKRGDYLELHHFLPKCIFGENMHLVALTFREHYIAHLLIAMHINKVYGKCDMLFKVVHPLNRMRGLKKNQHKLINSTPFARTYELARKLYIEAVTGRKRSEETIARMRNRVIKDSTREKLSKINTGIGNPMYGKTLTLDHKKKLSIAKIGKKLPLSAHQKITGENHIRFGTNHTVEAKEMMRQSSYKNYVIESDIGEVFKILGLKKFCELNKINQSMIIKQSKKGLFYKGFKILSSSKQNSNDA